MGNESQNDLSDIDRSPKPVLASDQTAISIAKGVWTKADCGAEAMRAAGKDLSHEWGWVIRAKRVGALLPALKTILTEFGKHPYMNRDGQETIVENLSQDCLTSSQ